MHGLLLEENILDFFIFVSPLSGTLGAPGCGDMAMTVPYLDVYSTQQWSLGHLTMSVSLANFKDLRHQDQNSTLDQNTFASEQISFTEADIHEILSDLFQSPSPQRVVGISTKLGRQWDPNGASALGRDARFIALQELGLRSARNAGTLDEGESLADKLTQAQTLEEVKALTSDMLMHKLAGIFSITLDVIDLSMPLASFGIDSLVAVELRNVFLQKIGAEVSSFEILQAATLKQLIKDIASKRNFTSSS